jgi:hypothetical protein
VRRSAADSRQPSAVSSTRSCDGAAYRHAVENEAGEVVQAVTRAGRRARRLGQVRPEPAHLLQYLRGRADQPGATLVPAAEQLVGSDRHRRCHRTRHSHHGAAQLAAPAGGRRGPTARRRLDHDGAFGQSRDEPVADQEPAAVRRAPGRPLADQQTGGGDQLEQRPVSRRVGTVEPAGQHRHRDTVGGERGPVRGAVDAQRTAGDHGPAAVGQPEGDLGGNVLAVRRRRP